MNRAECVWISVGYGGGILCKRIIVGYRETLVTERIRGG
jgi:hypothetical protein